LDESEILAFLFVNNASGFIQRSIINDNCLKFFILVSRPN
jgi:hypothetical protein